MRILKRFMSETNLTWSDVSAMAKATCEARAHGKEVPKKCLHSLLDSWAPLFLYNYESKKVNVDVGVLSHGMTDNYLSQIKQVICENYMPLEDGRCRETRSNMKQIFKERDVRMTFCCTIH